LSKQVLSAKNKTHRLFYTKTLEDPYVRMYVFESSSYWCFPYGNA